MGTERPGHRIEVEKADDPEVKSGKKDYPQGPEIHKSYHRLAPLLIEELPMLPAPLPYLTFPKAST